MLFFTTPRGKGLWDKIIFQPGFYRNGISCTVTKPTENTIGSAIDIYCFLRKRLEISWTLANWTMATNATATISTISIVVISYSICFFFLSNSNIVVNTFLQIRMVHWYQRCFSKCFQYCEYEQAKETKHQSYLSQSNMSEPMMAFTKTHRTGYY